MSDDNLATDPNMRKIFRNQASFSGGLIPSRKGFLSEHEARQLDAEDIIMILKNCGDSGSETCDLSFLNLREIPPALLTLSNVTHLNLENNQLTSLPNDFFMPFITHLCLRQNRLTRLPNIIGAFDSLVELNVKNNLLMELPLEFSELNSLKKLVADVNHLSEVPKCCMTGMAQLAELFLIDNSLLTALPQTAADWEVRITTGALKLCLELDNAPELVASLQLLRDQVPQLSNRLEVRWHKIWPDLVIEGLALGSLRTTHNKTAIAQLGVTHVLSCGRNLKTPSFPGHISHLVLEVEDTEEENMHPHFIKAIQFIDSAISRKGLCLVHCFAGVSRSATVVVSYLMKTRRMTVSDALHFVQEHRPTANPNPAFRNQLAEFEKMCV